MTKSTGVATQSGGRSWQCTTLLGKKAHPLVIIGESTVQKSFIVSFNVSKKVVNMQCRCLISFHPHDRISLFPPRGDRPYPYLLLLRLLSSSPLPSSCSPLPKTPTILLIHFPPRPLSPRKSFSRSANGSSPRSGILRPYLSNRAGRSTVVSDAADGEGSRRGAGCASLPEMEWRR